MIFPGHVAASVLCHRYLKVDLRVALVAGVLPDLVDKLLYYGLHVVPSSRVPMHTLWAWLASVLLVWAAAWLIKPPAAQTMAWSWLAGYGAHLLCDSPLVGGRLPFLWPWLAYDFSSAHLPFGFLFGLDRWPVATLIAEAALVALTLWDTVRRRALVAQAALAPTIPSGVPDARSVPFPRLAVAAPSGLPQQLDAVPGLAGWPGAAASLGPLRPNGQQRSPGRGL